MTPTTLNEQPAPTARTWSAILRANGLPMLLLLLVSLAVMVRFDRPLVRGDGVAYLAWVDTFALDQDINFDNQFERLASVNTYQLTWNDETQRLVNIFPFGVAILQTPFYLLGHLFWRMGWYDLNPDYFYQMQGVGLPYSLWLMIGANMMGLGAILFSWLVARRLTGRWTAVLTTFVLFLGTPLFYYSTVSPLNSHNPGAFTTAVFIFALVECTQAFRPKQQTQDDIALGWWLLLGGSGGMMILVRWQLLVVVAAGLALLLWQRRWRGLLIAGLLTALVALPLPLIWQQMFNQPIVIPYEAVEGGTFLKLSTNGWWVLRETPRNSPILYLSFLGIFFLWRINRPWAVFTAVAIAAQIIVNGAVLDFWGGETYGIRRMTELFPLYVVLASAALGTWSGSNWRSWQNGWQLLSRAYVVIMLGYSALYIFAFFSFHWTNPDHIFIAGPETMIPYFLNQGNRWEIIASIFRTHLGPPAWPMPGP